MIVSTLRNKMYSVFLIYAMMAFSPSHASSIFEWSWVSGDVYIEGQFQSNIDSGTITETDITSSFYSVYQNNDLLYEIDLINELLFLNGSEITARSNYHFEYTIGSSSFNEISPDDPSAYPIELDVNVGPDDFYGLSFYNSSPYHEWDLSYGANYEYASTIGFSSGPIISSVPLPSAVWLFSSALIGLVGFAKRKKA